MRFARFLPLTLLAGALPLLTGLDACLGLCDYNTDPNCEDPTKAQILGQVTVPEAGGELAGFTRIEGELATTLKAEMSREIMKARAQGQVPTKVRRPMKSDRNRVPDSKTRVERFRPGEIIVKAREQVRDRKAELAQVVEIDLREHFGQRVRVDVGLCGTPHRCVVHVFDQEGKPFELDMTAEAVAALSDHPFLEYAEKNLILQMTAQPNDEFFTLQWHYAAIDLPTAWDITVGDPNVVAAVIDTGIILDHPDLEGRIIGPGADLISDESVANDGDGRDDDGYDVGDDAGGPGRHSYHGSHVAGTMGAETDDGDMVAGITWEGGLLPVRVLGAGGGSLSDIADGILWSVGADVEGVAPNDTPADVINMSLGGFGESQVMNEAVAEATAGGCIVIVAAGNDDTDATEFTPANAPDAITVASHGNTGPGRGTPRKASYSNFGSKVDVAAPGGEQAEDVDNDGQPDGVLSTVEDFVTFYQGTSMAAPHVAGIAMLMKSVDPTIFQEDARQILKDSSNPDVDCPEGCGAGRVSAAAALFALQGGLDGPQVIASPAFLRVGLGQTETPVVFKNIGTAGTDVTLSIGGADRAKCNLGSTSGTVDSKGQLVTDLVIERNEAADDRGECTVSATFEGGSSEARIVWSEDEVQALTTVDVGAVRVDGDNLSVERLVTTTEIEQFQYKLFNLTPGTYLVVGLVDTDNNGSYDDDVDAVGIFIPDVRDDETACNQASCGRLSIGEGERVENASFTVVPGFGGGDDGTGGTGDGALGDGCASSSDCGGGLYCELTLPGGYCTTDCAGTGDCPAGGLCFSLVDATGEEYSVCLEECASADECRTGEGYTCDADSTCYPG